jgi:hypothetical protein
MYHREALPRLVCTFLASNPKVDYRGFLVGKAPECEVREVHALAQKIVKQFLQRG